MALATLVVPALRVAGTTYLLLAVRRRPPAPVALLRPMFRLVHALRPWAQVEILMLGAMVASGKLASVFHVVPGIGAAVMAGFLLRQMAVGASFDARLFWERAVPREAPR